VENKSIRLRTVPGENKNIQIKIDQNFDILEVLSLKISQEDLYNTFCANYGVVVGRVIANNGFGVPNAKVSVFVPISSEDEQNELITQLYPYKTSVSKNGNTRYNLLLSEATCNLNRPVGTFPTKTELLENDIWLEIYDKYYKFTTSTNNSGDYMIFGVPTGNQTLHMDVDLSDMGLISIRPYDMTKAGYSERLFDSSVDFKIGDNLDELVQIKTGNISTNVIPFWGDPETCEVGITRVDFDINQKIELTSTFMGSVFTDNAKNSLNKNCNPRNNQGENENLQTGSGTIKAIRVSDYKKTDWYTKGEITPLSLETYEDSDLEIDDDGTFVCILPMNVGHMITDEYGNLTPSDDPQKGIATKGLYRFAMNLNENKGGRVRRTATAIFPSLGTQFDGSRGIVNGSLKVGTQDQKFTDNIEQYRNIDPVKDINYDTIKKDFHTFEWKQIYTISQYIKKYKKGGNRFSFLGLKNTDVGPNNPLPYNNIIYKPNIGFSLGTVLTNIQTMFIRMAVALVLLKIGVCWSFKINLKILRLGSCGCIRFRPLRFLQFIFFGIIKNDPDYNNEIKCSGGDVDDKDRGTLLTCGERIYCINVTRQINDENDKNPCGSLGDGDSDDTEKDKKDEKCDISPTEFTNNWKPVFFPRDTSKKGNETCTDEKPLQTITRSILDVNDFPTVKITNYYIKCSDLINKKEGDDITEYNNQDLTTSTIKVVKQMFEGCKSCCERSPNNCGCDIITFKAGITDSRFIEDCGTNQKRFKTHFRIGGLPSSCINLNDIIDEWKCCIVATSAEENNVWRRVFFDGWLTGSAYLFQYKYKKKRLGNEDFCGPGSDNSGWDGFKNQDCCFAGDCSEFPLIRGNKVSGRDLNHDSTVPLLNDGETINPLFKNVRVTNGAVDVGDHIYTNNLFTTKIVNVGPMQMCEDVLNSIYLSLNDTNVKGINLYNVETETGWDIGPNDPNIINWVTSNPSTSYNDPFEYLYYVLLQGGNCRVNPLFRGGGGCTEYETENTPTNTSSEPFYSTLSKLSTIYTEIETKFDNTSNSEVYDGLTIDNEYKDRFSPSTHPIARPNDNQLETRKNIPYFYFGLKPGATAIDKLKVKYFKPFGFRTINILGKEIKIPIY
jgi:hypothetical protein